MWPRRQEETLPQAGSFNPGTNNLTNTNNIPLNATGYNRLPAFDFLAANTAALSTASFPMGTSNTASIFFVGQMKTATANFGGAVCYAVGADFNGAGSA